MVGAGQAPHAGGAGRPTGEGGVRCEGVGAQVGWQACRRATKLARTRWDRCAHGGCMEVVGEAKEGVRGPRAHPPARRGLWRRRRSCAAPAWTNRSGTA